jgi:hypothetical protein
MNEARRKKLQKAGNLLVEALGLITEVKDNEEETFENLAEGAQKGDIGQKMEEAISYLDEAIDNLDTAKSNLDSASRRIVLPHLASLKKVNPR